MNCDNPKCQNLMWIEEYNKVMCWMVKNHLWEKYKFETAEELQHLKPTPREIKGGDVVKVQKSGWDSFQYVIACILTLGGAWILRIVISQAIRMSLTAKEPEVA